MEIGGFISSILGTHVNGFECISSISSISSISININKGSIIISLFIRFIVLLVLISIKEVLLIDLFIRLIVLLYYL